MEWFARVNRDVLGEGGPMAESTSTSVGPKLIWYSAAVRYFVHGVSMPAIFALTLPSFSKEEAVVAAHAQFTMLSHDPVNDAWRSPEGLMITPWRVDVIEIPEPYSSSLSRELEAMLAEAAASDKKKRRVRRKLRDNVVSLFPDKPDAPPEAPVPPEPDLPDDPDLGGS